MRILLKFILLSPIIVSINSCHFICTEGKGDLKSERRKVSDFNEIDLSIAADLTIKKGSNCSFEIEAEENLLEKIKTKIHGDELEIGTDWRCIDPNQRIKIFVTMPELDGLTIDGSGHAFVPDTFTVSKLSLEINGSGDISAKLVAAEIISEINGSGDLDLSGSANKHKIKINGSGNVRASQLPCNISDIHVNGSGDVNVYAIQNLKVKVNGSGSVHYKGKPSVSTQINGSGKVVDEN